MLAKPKKVYWQQPQVVFTNPITTVFFFAWVNLDVSATKSFLKHMCFCRFPSSRIGACEGSNSIFVCVDRGEYMFVLGKISVGILSVSAKERVLLYFYGMLTCQWKKCRNYQWRFSPGMGGCLLIDLLLKLVHEFFLCFVSLRACLFQPEARLVIRDG